MTGLLAGLGVSVVAVAVVALVRDLSVRMGSSRAQRHREGGGAWEGWHMARGGWLWYLGRSVRVHISVNGGRVRVESQEGVVLDAPCHACRVEPVATGVRAVLSLQAPLVLHHGGTRFDLCPGQRPVRLAWRRGHGRALSESLRAEGEIEATLQDAQTRAHPGRGRGEEEERTD